MHTYTHTHTYMPNATIYHDMNVFKIYFTICLHFISLRVFSGRVQSVSNVIRYTLSKRFMVLTIFPTYKPNQMSNTL